MSGHVFVLQGDLKQLACDDVLIPCDSMLNISTPWTSLLQPSHRGSEWFRLSGMQTPERFDKDNRPPVPVGPIEDGRRIWLVNTAHGNGDVDWLVSGVRTALQAVEEDRAGAPRQGRARRLIGLPIVGVGEGGYDGQQGKVIDQLVETLERHVARPGAPDVALVLYRRSDFAAVQSRRRPSFHGLSDAHRGLVRRLGERIRDGEVVLFMGSGVSAAAGYPTWRKLLEELLESADIHGDEAAAVMSLPAPDAADVIGEALDADGLHTRVAQIMASRPYALAHGLLASLRISEAVTTNYDTLYETAAVTAHDQPPRVLPRERALSGRSWLLKLHGDVEMPDSIVLTREHYLDFDSVRGPLGAMVQAHMLTRHLLFLGYSLSDENVLKLARQVRRLFKFSGVVPSTTGTVISLFADRGRERLWGEDLSFHPIDNGPYEPDGVSEAARGFEIFMDALVHEAVRYEQSYLFDPRYWVLLSAPEQALVAATTSWLAELEPAAKETKGFTRIRSVLAELGHRGEGATR